jgi:histidine kinase
MSEDQIAELVHKLENLELPPQYQPICQQVKAAVKELRTQLELQRARTIHSDRLASLAEMSIGVAHELNQPLNAILMSAQLVRMWLEKGDNIDRQRLDYLMSGIEKSVQRSAKIINHMREFGSGSSGFTRPLDINLPIIEVFDLLREQLKSEKVEVVFDLTEDLPLIKADNYQMQQIFFQFISNARHAMNDKEASKKDPSYQRKLLVRTELSEDFRVFASIEDNGAGIPEENLKRIFEPFFTTKEVGKGSGLGLAIIYGLVQQYNGNIEVESKYGKGTKFTIKFPPA